MNNFEKLLGIGVATLFFPLALVGAALALIPLALMGALLITGLLAEAVAVRRVNAMVVARQPDRAN